MKYGQQEEQPQVDEEIQQVALPQVDPAGGTDGFLMKIWKRKGEMILIDITSG